jgi:hypothetical protein
MATRNLPTGASATSTIEDLDINGRPVQFQDENDSPIKSGWSALKESSTDNYPINFKHTNQPALFRFLDLDGPVADFSQHWLDEKVGQKSYICIDTHTVRCPLCHDLGDKPTRMAKFNVINLNSAPFSLEIYTVTSMKLLATLGSMHRGDTGPLTQNFWQIARSGTGPTTTYNVNRVKERDLLEDHAIDPEHVKEYQANVRLWNRDAFKLPSVHELASIANDLK